METDKMLKHMIMILKDCFQQQAQKFVSAPRKKPKLLLNGGCCQAIFVAGICRISTCISE